MRQKDGRLAWSAPRPFTICYDESGMVSSNAKRSDSANLSASCPTCLAMAPPPRTSKSAILVVGRVPGGVPEGAVQDVEHFMVQVRPHGMEFGCHIPHAASAANACRFLRNYIPVTRSCSLHRDDHDSCRGVRADPGLGAPRTPPYSAGSGLLPWRHAGGSPGF